MSPQPSPRILVLGAGRYYVGVLERLQKSGFTTLVVDRDPEAPGFATADVWAVVDIVDHPAVARQARDWNIDGILAVNDFGVRTAAEVSTRLGLVGLSVPDAEAACDKGLMRDRWRAAGLPNPDYRVATSPAAARAAALDLGPPLVVKPTDAGGGGRGVSVVRSLSELEWALEFVAPFCQNGRIIVERFLDGVELTVESISWGGEVHVLTMSDKEKPEMRTRVATSLNYPAAIDEGTWAQVAEVARGAVASIGLVDGPSHVEVILTAEGPVLVEMGARGGGGHIFSTIVEAVTGVDMAVESARVLCGDRPSLVPTRRCGCVYRLLTPQNGVVRAITGLDTAWTLPGVIDVGVTRRPGDVLGSLDNSLQRSGYAVVVGASREEAISRADAAERAIVFELDPLPDS